ncbi:MAG: GNAT family N-acetyltransferase [Stomatobaculum sp.]|nr:GNAT family N-acetyltransferase [Stomatobaculum sp.]
MRMSAEENGNGGRSVRLLTQEEKQLTRFLYEEAFPEDGQKLTDYYYRIKMAGNEVFAALDSTGHASGMLCLNPYRVMVRGTEYPLSYIVAVATEKAHRREGIMRSVLTAALRHLHSRSETLRAGHLPGIPFTYLKPADPAYYRPFGFAYISRRERRALKQDAPVTREMFSRRNMPAAREAKALQTIAAFMNAFLAERFEVYCCRDGRYLQELFCEIEAGDGHLDLLYDKAAADTSGRPRIAGTAVYDYPGVRENMTRLLTKEEYLAAAETPEEPFFMARIVDLPAFLEMLEGTNAAEHENAAGPENASAFRFYFDDPLIPENRGGWEIRAGSVARCSDEADLPVFTPEQLETLLSGYRTPGREAAAEEAAEQELLRFVKPLRGIYFDEET